jgi:hypothetical protein
MSHIRINKIADFGMARLWRPHSSGSASPSRLLRCTWLHNWSRRGGSKPENVPMLFGGQFLFLNPNKNTATVNRPSKVYFRALWISKSNLGATWPRGTGQSHGREKTEFAHQPGKNCSCIHSLISLSRNIRKARKTARWWTLAAHRSTVRIPQGIPDKLPGST